MKSSSMTFLLVQLVCMVVVFGVDGLQTTSVPPLLDVPTYSLATLNQDGSTNMNIVTYCTPVSIRPDRVWSLGIYKETLTKDNLLRNPTCILQLLTEPQAELVRILGGQSGKDTDKKQECAQAGFAWTKLGDEESGIDVLPGCAHYIKIKIQGEMVDGGSHLILPVCQVEDMFVDETNKEGHLSTARLSELGIITEQGRVAT